MPKLPAHCHFNYSRGKRFIRFRKGNFSTYLTGKLGSKEFKDHYANALKGIKRPPKAMIIDDFWNYVDRSAGLTKCWPWTKHIDREGYGRAISRHDDEVLAHRHAWRFSYGNIPCGLQVLHSCDNPACCNPKHLFLGTHQDNMRDRNKKRRFHSVLDDADIRVIRKLHRSGISSTVIGRRFDISQSHVSHICAGRIWKDV